MKRDHRKKNIRKKVLFIHFRNWKCIRKLVTIFAIILHGSDIDVFLFEFRFHLWKYGNRTL